MNHIHLLLIVLMMGLSFGTADGRRPERTTPVPGTDRNAAPGALEPEAAALSGPETAGGREDDIRDSRLGALDSAGPGVDVQIGVESIILDGNGIRISTPRGPITLTPGSKQPTPIRPAPGGRATDLLLPNLPADAAGRPLFQAVDPYSLYPATDLMGGPPTHPNRLSAYFSSASGGFGFRFAYDRRLSPTLRFTAGPEFLTYGLF